MNYLKEPAIVITIILSTISIITMCRRLCSMFPLQFREVGSISLTFEMEKLKLRKLCKG